MPAFPGAWQAGIKHLSIKLTAPGRKERGRKRIGGELGTQLQAVPSLQEATCLPDTEVRVGESRAASPDSAL